MGRFTLTIALLPLLSVIAGRSVLAASVTPGSGDFIKPPVAQTALSPDDPHAYRLAPGPWLVATQDLDLHDAARGKDLPIRVYIPAPASHAAMAAGKLPLVIFSHGSGGDRRAAPKLLGHWASYGYVVIAPTHADSASLQRKQNRSAGRSQRQVKTGVNHQGRLDRVADLKLILDRIPELERRIPQLAGRVEAARVAVTGHSAGAMSAMQIGGLVQDSSYSDLRDPRVRCVILLSGAGRTDKMKFDPQAWDNFTLPALVITGSLDYAGSSDQTPESYRDPFEQGPATGDKYLLFITGATHMSFAGNLAARTPEQQRQLSVGGRPRGGYGAIHAMEYDQAAIFQQMECGTLAFLDAYVKGDADAKRYLQSGAIRGIGPGVEWQRK
jgi:predicted dienelactone hydrolase